ncbi:hypothetical protein FA15DRAFT_669413 [Coprinopsis marcescibilis]|uniref:GTP binding protein 2 n=1 Tax=Coprinopsis marcescibilis TaxID=230819 RepID=A0A5C3KVT4_COPMA|nr:hypothetical protein FA15DRAFT_669413 [Coprinopsis marcescibilis]
MFGESESESPRVPSPWDNIISHSPSPAPPSHGRTPSPLASELAAIPRLVPESDDGNVEYKLQLLDPSPGRFARLVTQLKWRLLEGGGQAYYELGVADGGDLVGLPREDLERSLETLEMMAGEIGASVIVVKEVEVPVALARLAKRSGDAGGVGKRGAVVGGEEEEGEGNCSSWSGLSSLSNSDVDLSEGDEGDAISGVNGRAEKPALDSGAMFSMDGEDSGIYLEIASVFKPRPVRTKSSFENHVFVGGKNKRGYKKQKNVLPQDSGAEKQTKAEVKRQARDKKREEKRKNLVALAAQSVGEPAIKTAVSTMEALQITTDEPASFNTVVEIAVFQPIPSISVSLEEGEDEDDDDVFPLTAKRTSYSTFPSTGLTESHLDVDPVAVKLAGAMRSTSSEDDEKPRLIVEALVVRKMSLDEAFLDFGGFGII